MGWKLENKMNVSWTIDINGVSPLGNRFSRAQSKPLEISGGIDVH